MQTAAYLAQRFREVILDGRWIANTNFKHELAGTNWQIAVKQYQQMNSMATLAQHIHYYIKGIKNVLEGHTLEISDRFSFDFPAIESQDQWNAILETFWQDSEQFAILVKNLSENQLQEDFVDKIYGSYYRNIDGMIEHSYYHLGQIVFIKKLLNQ